MIFVCIFVGVLHSVAILAQAVSASSWKILVEIDREFVMFRGFGFGGAAGAGGAGGAAAPGGPAGAAFAGGSQPGDLTRLLGIGAHPWTHDPANFGANPRTTVLRADIAQRSSRTNTSQDTLLDLSRASYIYLPNQAITQLNNFTSEEWHLPASPGATELARMGGSAAWNDSLWIPTQAPVGNAVLDDAGCGQHSAAMYARAIVLAHGDCEVLCALSSEAKLGNFPLGDFKMPEMPREQVYRLSVGRIFLLLMGLAEVPLRVRSLEDAMAALSIGDISVDPASLTDAGIQEVITRGLAPSPDRIHAVGAQCLVYFLHQGGMEAVISEETPDVVSISRRMSNMLEIAELRQPKSWKDRRQKQADSVLLASLVVGALCPGALCYLYCAGARVGGIPMTVGNVLGGPGNIDTRMGVKHLFFRGMTSFALDGKLPERLSLEKIWVAGTAELRWISEGIRLIVSNGLEPVFLAPGTRQNVDNMVQIYRTHPVGLPHLS